jgi:hypothetical protein
MQVKEPLGASNTVNECGAKQLRAGSRRRSCEGRDGLVVVDVTSNCRPAAASDWSSATGIIHPLDSSVEHFGE